MYDVLCMLACCPRKESNLRPLAYHASALPLSYLGLIHAPANAKAFKLKQQRKLNQSRTSQASAFA